MRLYDRLENLVANLGTGRDKQSATRYVARHLDDEELLNAYRYAWLPRKIVDIPALDAIRKWRDWQAESADISRVEAEEKRLGIRLKLRQALERARLWGGAAIYIGTGQMPDTPLTPESIGKGGIRYLTVFSRRQLTPGDLVMDPMDERYMQPADYRISGQTGEVRIHPSRLVILVGNPHPEPELATGFTVGWGDSVLQSTLDQVSQGDSAAANAASLVFEAKTDVIRIPDFMVGMDDADYREKVLKRFTLAAIAKGNNGAMLLDKEEEYEQKTYTFAGLTDLILTAMQLVSGAADIPLTRLLGQSPGGLNASGEHDLKNYYDRVSSIQELDITPALSVLDECLIRSALGSRPEDVWYQWSSLWQTSEMERSEIRKQTADTVSVLATTRLWPDEVLQLAATNLLTETGAVPGLEGAMADWLTENPDGMESDETDPDRPTDDPEDPPDE